MLIRKLEKLVIEANYRFIHYLKEGKLQTFKSANLRLS